MRALLSLSWFALVASITWDLRDTNGNLIQDRQQWQKNDGYCGETSFMMAGMHLAGQYVSEYDVRAAANPSMSASSAQAHQLLIGDVGSTDTNDKAASDKLKLRSAFYTPTTPSTGNVGEYLGWIKAQLRQGRAPTITVYCQNCGNDEYDHIITAISYESTFNDDLFHTGDAFTYCDHLGAYPSGNADDGDYTASDWQAIAANSGIDASSCTRIEVNSLTDPFFGSRDDADARTSWTMPDQVRNFGIAHLGPVDLNNELLQVEMTSDKTFEAPEIQSFSVGNGARPASMDLTLTITVKGLSTETTKQYVLLWYNHEDDVPTSNFAQATTGCVWTTFPGHASTKYTATMQIRSSDKVFLRAIEMPSGGVAAPTTCPAMPSQGEDEEGGDGSGSGEVAARVVKAEKRHDARLVPFL